MEPFPTASGPRTMLDSAGRLTEEVLKNLPRGETVELPTPGGTTRLQLGQDGKPTFQEYVSRARLGSWALVHVVKGVDPATGRRAAACGVIAVGWRATGVIPVGVVAVGGLPVGVVAVGLLSVGVVGLGLLCGVGALATGAVACGGAAVGGVAVGGAAAGYLAVGGVAFGDTAVGLLAYGRDVTTP